jgi:hypothetical protein
VPRMSNHEAMPSRTGLVVSRLTGPSWSEKDLAVGFACAWRKSRVDWLVDMGGGSSGTRKKNEDAMGQNRPGLWWRYKALVV